MPGTKPKTGPDPDSEAALCVGCGLCCDGTFLARAYVEPGEKDGLTAVGLSIESEDDKHWFTLPCGAYGDGRCTVYEARPGVCRSFRCKLLKSFQAGEIDLGTALEKVEVAIDLRRKIIQQEPGAARQTDRRRLQMELNASKQRPQLLLNIISLEYFLDQWFRKKKNDADGEIGEATQAAADNAKTRP